jgi:hypothetical protein
MPRLHLSNAIGSYPDREEFQVERIIVWVAISALGDRASWLRRADLMFEEIWRAIPAVVRVAQQASRAEIPEFWIAHDETGTADKQLAVRWLWIDSASGSTDYDVGPNYDFTARQSAGLPEFPDDHSIMVSRQPDGELVVRG